MFNETQNHAIVQSHLDAMYSMTPHPDELKLNRKMFDFAVELGKHSDKATQPQYRGGVIGSMGY